MSIEAVGDVLGVYVQNVAGTTIAETVNEANTAVSSASLALQEATETLAQTEKEAATGDPIAIARLLHEQHEREALAAADTSTPPDTGIGHLIDKAA